MSVISNFIFHEGDDGLIKAVTRDNYFDLFNDRSKVLYRSRSYTSLKSLIEKTGGDPTKLHEFMKSQEFSEVEFGCTVPEVPENHGENY